MAYISDLEKEILRLVNLHRAKLGLNNLAFHNEIQECSREHTFNMAVGITPFGHDGFQERAAKIIESVGGTSAAENVAHGQQTAQEVLQSWLDSAGHRKNIEGDFDLTGISVEKDASGRQLFCQLFLKHGKANAEGGKEGGELSAEAFSEELHRQVNKHRKGFGMPDLLPNERIVAAAQKHSEKMASGDIGFGHDGFQERIAGLVNQLGGIGAAENVAQGDGQVKRIIASWLGSSGHRKNIEGDYNLTGIGAAKNEKGIWFFTQIFIRKT